MAEAPRPAVAVPAGSVLPPPGTSIVVCGYGVTGQSAVKYLVGRGHRVLITADRDVPVVAPELAASGLVTAAAGLTEPPAGTALVVTSPGFPPGTPLFGAAERVGIPVIGDVELAWLVDRQDPRDWLVVTGTNGKTTTVGMLEAILRAAGRTVTACGNVGWPALDAVLAADRPASHGPAVDLPAAPGPARQDVIAAELSSFQLHYAPTVRPLAGLVLNLVEDHLDWYGGSMSAYGADKARALRGPIAVAVVDDPGAAQLLADSPAGRKVAVTAGPPPELGLGVRDGTLWDNAFGAGALLPADQIRPAGTHNVTNALSAAALALAAGATGPQVAAGLRAFEPGDHRNVPVGEHHGVRYVNDSKATNPHAAMASLTSYPRVVWIAGGQLKGASIRQLVVAVADRLAGVVVLGIDSPLILSALAEHAPQVPVVHVRGADPRIMTEVVRAAAEMAAPGDVVLLAPAAASLDMFRSYAARGHAFAWAVQALASG